MTSRLEEKNERQNSIMALFWSVCITHSIVSDSL